MGCRIQEVVGREEGYYGGMAIEWDRADGRLPALKREVPPVVAVESLVAVAEVRLRAGDLPGRVLKDFYVGVLGMKFLEGDVEGLRFVHQRRRVALVRAAEVAGHAAFLVKEFSQVIVRLREKGIWYEVIHGDAGMTRMAYLRDPAGNWVQLVETRGF